MARLLFIAHDPGGAFSFIPVIQAMAKSEHEVLIAGKGPAKEAWQKLPGEQIDLDETELSSLTVDLVISGGSFHSTYEKTVWQQARVFNIPVLFYFDAWTNLEKILTLPDGTIFQPDVIATSCRGSADVLAQADWCKNPATSVGMPTLEAEISRLQTSMGGVSSPSGKLVFFSEPVCTDYPDHVLGFDQFSVFDQIMTHIAPDLDIFVQPHLREDESLWIEHCRNMNVTIERRSLSDWIDDAVMVVGINSAILIMARALGAPVLSVQVGRTRVANHLLESLDDIFKVTQAEDLPGALLYLELEQYKADHESDTLYELHGQSCSRFCRLIEQALEDS